MATTLLSLTDTAPPPNPESRRHLSLAFVRVFAEQARQGRRPLDDFGEQVARAFSRGATLAEVAEAAGLGGIR